MVEEIEISKLDLRFEGCRIKNKGAEADLLSSIAENGIREPLEGVSSGNGVSVLLNGFKRYRCARKLGILTIPYSSLGSDEALAIIKLLRVSNSKSLTILEQSRLIDQLRSLYRMSVSDIASMLERSKSWVSMRIGISGQMSEVIMKEIFSGRFPAYSYMYTLRQFIRMNSIKRDEIDKFVSSVSGKGLSIRQIELLACGYFKGSDGYREQIESGNIQMILNQCGRTNLYSQECNASEQKMLNYLDAVQKYMRYIIYNYNNKSFKHNTFFAQANLLCGGVLRIIGSFHNRVGELYDKSGKAQGNIPASCRRDEYKGDQPTSFCEP